METHPKSPILTRPSLPIRRLAGLRSLEIFLKNKKYLTDESQDSNDASLQDEEIFGDVSVSGETFDYVNNASHQWPGREVPTQSGHSLMPLEMVWGKTPARSIKKRRLKKRKKNNYKELHIGTQCSYQRIMILDHIWVNQSCMCSWFIQCLHDRTNCPIFNGNKFHSKDSFGILRWVALKKVSKPKKERKKKR